MNWEIHSELLTERDKRWMIAAMIKIAVIIMGQSTYYSFGGILYRLAKISMGKWDQAWADVMLAWGIKCKIYMRYIDDLRIYAYPIKPGWTWTQNGWVYDTKIISEECDIRKTCDEFCKTFNSIMDFLEFTSESEVDFESRYLPTLNMQTKVMKSGLVLYKLY